MCYLCWEYLEKIHIQINISEDPRAGTYIHVCIYVGVDELDEKSVSKFVRGQKNYWDSPSELLEPIGRENNYPQQTE